MQTISDYLESDRQRLDAMLPVVLELLDRHQLARAMEQFADFSYGLNRHMDIEERVLLPAFEEWTGLRTGPTRLMRAEHLEIREWMSGVATSLRASNETESRRGLSMLIDLLAAYDVNEEHILYQMTNDATDAAERETLVRQMQEI